MTVLQTIGVYLLIPLAVYGVLSLFTLWPRIARGPRYRPGQEWKHEPLWWTGNPQAVGAPDPVTATSSTTSTAHGGARGSW